MAWAAANRRRIPISTSSFCMTARWPGLGELADAIWYPIWDSKLSLDHSVRTPEQAVAVAKDDLKALLGLLDIRHIAGDPGHDRAGCAATSSTSGGRPPSSGCRR